MHMSPLRAYKLLLVGLIGVYAGKLVIGRVAVLGDEYTKAHTAYWEHRDQQEDCDGRDATHHKFSDACGKARDGVKRWPVATALSGLAHETHSCIEFPCTELARDVAESWSALVGMSVVLLSLAYFLCAGVYERIARWQRYNQYHHPHNSVGHQNYGPPAFVAPNAATLQAPDDAAIHFNYDPEAEPEYYPRDRAQSPVRRRVQPSLMFASQWSHNNNK